MQVRDERPDDFDAVRAINVAAFGQPAEARLVDALRSNCKTCLSLVAVGGDCVVGHILFTPVVVEGASSGEVGMGLAPLAVRPDRQRQGVGTALVNEGLARLRQSGCPYVVVLGHPDYYPRFGFQPASAYGLRCEWDVPDHAFMVCVFHAERIPTQGGLVRYRPEFIAAS
ncbi:MAG: N-acetyltransferase [Candidatus Hydrogenedentota bacterium]